jgi:hypothetical protein
MTEEFEEGNRKKIALLIDGWVNGFCIVSSDSDYTRLATRIRDERKNNILD